MVKYQQQPPITSQGSQKQLVNVILDTFQLSDVLLPPVLQPTFSTPVNGGYTVAQFFYAEGWENGPVGGVGQHLGA